MLNPAKKVLISTKNFVADHKVAIAVVTTATITVVVARKAYGNAYVIAEKFIEEKGLSDEYMNYFPGE